MEEGRDRRDRSDECGINRQQETQKITSRRRERTLERKPHCYGSTEPGTSLFSKNPPGYLAQISDDTTCRLFSTRLRETTELPSESALKRERRRERGRKGGGKRRRARDRDTKQRNCAVSAVKLYAVHRQRRAFPQREKRENRVFLFYNRRAITARLRYCAEEPSSRW